MSDKSEFVGRAEWDRRLQEWKASKLTQAEYCKKNGYKVGTLRWNLRRVREANGIPKAKTGPKPKSNNSPSPKKETKAVQKSASSVKIKGSVIHVAAGLKIKCATEAEANRLVQRIEKGL